MIVVDSAALIAILEEESDAATYAAAIQQAHRSLISAVNVHETGIVRKDAHGLQGKDRLIDRIAAAFGLGGDRLVAREAEAGPAVVETEQHRLEHLHIGAGDRAAMLALLPVLGVVALHKGLEPGLGVAVERDASGMAEHLLAPGAQMFRQTGSSRHEFPSGLQQQPARQRG